MVTTVLPVEQFCYSAGLYTDTQFPGFTFPIGGGGVNRSLGVLTRSTNKNPSWRVQVAKKVDASTDYFSDSWSWRMAKYDAYSFAHFRDLGQWRCIDGRYRANDINGYQLVNTTDDAALYDLALSRLKRRLSTNIGSFDAIVPVVELRDLRKSIRTLARASTDMVVAIARIKQTRGRSAVKFASEQWLNFSLAVRPTMNDIKNASDSIAHYLARTDKSLIVHGSARKEWLGAQILRGQAGSVGSNTVRSAVVKHKLSYRIVGGVDLKLVSSNNYGLVETFGLEIGEQLPSVGWELLPLSWVADYFGTVGAYLSDTFQLPSGALKYLVSCKRYTMQGQYTINTDIVTSDPPYQAFGTSSAGLLLYTYFQRTKLPSIPHLSLRFKSDDEVTKNVVNRLLNLVSVLGSGFQMERDRTIRFVRHLK